MALGLERTLQRLDLPIALLEERRGRAPMTHDDPQVWLDRYVAAWSSTTRSPSASSCRGRRPLHAWDKALKGRDAIVESWASDKDGPARGRPH